MRRFFNFISASILTICLLLQSAYSLDNAQKQNPKYIYSSFKIFQDLRLLKNNSGTDFDDLERKVNFGKKAKRLIEADTNELKNSIKVWENTSGDIVVNLKLKERDQRVRISVWNMLGKKVIEAYEGNAKDLPEEYVIKNSSILPKGVYLIIAQGDKVRLDSKFIISR